MRAQTQEILEYNVSRALEEAYGPGAALDLPKSNDLLIGVALFFAGIATGAAALSLLWLIHG
ncbi:MAG: hypothetical protein JSV72_11645 [Ralstonia sp.]|jgi:hypothetical protein|nr:MAG: hypothetical protein JSV72_11645 [Ralstonia sp.]